MALRKPNPGQMFGPKEVSFDDETFKSDYPTLHEYMVTDRWTDGSVRQTATLSIFVNDGAIKLVVNDRDNNRSAFFNARTFADLLAQAETSLRDETVDWKSRGGSGGGQSKGTDRVPY